MESNLLAVSFLIAFCAQGRAAGAMFFGREFNSSELRRYCGSTAQLGRISSYMLNDGSERGVRCLDFHTGSGLNFMVVPDRGMDIVFAEWRGLNLAYLTPQSLRPPGFRSSQEELIDRDIVGGLLSTLGPISVGAPIMFDGEPISRYGSLHFTPATSVSHDTVWAGDGLMLLAKGDLKECYHPRYHVSVQRRIQAQVGKRSVRIHDTITNDGLERVPHQMQYQINAGFPLVSEVSVFHTSFNATTPRDDNSDDEREHYQYFTAPRRGTPEICFFHNSVAMTDGRAGAAILNPELNDGIGLYVKSDPKVLPLMYQQKSFAEGIYNVAFGPTNCFNVGLDRQQVLGFQKYLEPEESVDYHIEIGILEGAYELMAFERECHMVSADNIEVGSPLN